MTTASAHKLLRLAKEHELRLQELYVKVKRKTRLVDGLLSEDDRELIAKEYDAELSRYIKALADCVED